ncbi:MAG: flagellar hook assembly protein FlgD [Paracoccaceae bacterium]|nr:MAG: flagellar hook assembly protein FlgD [Paracoccaceae bacterium]
MEIAAAATGTTASPSSAGRVSSETRINADFDTFLKMLTAQMRHQDPLNPIESADYAVQLATFSGVEQQTRMNQTLDTLLQRFDLQGLAQFAGWVGQEARSTAPVAFTGTPVTFHTGQPDPAADRAVLVVRDARGAVVAREELDIGATAHDWSGTGPTGTQLNPGTYSLSVERMQGDRLISTIEAETYARVDEVRSTPTGVQLVLAGGVEVAVAAVSALRRAT